MASVDAPQPRVEATGAAADAQPVPATYAGTASRSSSASAEGPGSASRFTHDDVAEENGQKPTPAWVSSRAERGPGDRRADDASRGTVRREDRARPDLAERTAQQEQQRAAARAGRVTVRRERRADRQLAALLSSLSAPAAGWVSPVTNPYRITATFGAHGRMWSSTHTGVDLAAPTGTPVRSVAAGTVTFAADSGAYGLRVAVRHEGGSETWYAHLSRTSVEPDQKVAQGATLGAIGATGNVTGPHLHLEFRPDGGAPVDPVDALRARGATL